MAYQKDITLLLTNALKKLFRRYVKCQEFQNSIQSTSIRSPRMNKFITIMENAVRVSLYLYMSDLAVQEAIGSVKTVLN